MRDTVYAGFSFSSHTCVVWIRLKSADRQGLGYACCFSTAFLEDVSLLSSAHERVPKSGMEVRVAFQAGFWEEEPATNYPTALLPTTYCMVYVHLLRGRWFDVLGLYQT